MIFYEESKIPEIKKQFDTLLKKEKFDETDIGFIKFYSERLAIFIEFNGEEFYNFIKKIPKEQQHYYREFIIQNLKGGDIFFDNYEYIFDTVILNKKIHTTAIFSILDDKFKEDPEFVKYAIIANGIEKRKMEKIEKDVEQQIRKIKETTIMGFETYDVGSIVKYLSPEFQLKHPEIIFLAIKENIENLEFINTKLLLNKDFKQKIDELKININGVKSDININGIKPNVMEYIFQKIQDLVKEPIKIDYISEKEKKEFFDIYSEKNCIRTNYRQYVR